MATKVGTLVKLKIGSIFMVGEMSSSMASVANLIEVSSKASNRASNFEYGRIAETLSVSSIGSTDAEIATYNFKAALSAQKAGTKIEIAITEYTTAPLAVSGAIMISGTVLLSNVSFENPDNDKLTFSLDMTFDGDSRIETNPATDFLDYTMAEQTGAATINTTAHTVAIEVANGTVVTALVATFIGSGLATIAVGATPQVSGTTANDFTSPVVYAITAADGTTAQNWTVTVTVA
jgi:dihydroneopterin aldolase